MVQRNYRRIAAKEYYESNYSTSQQVLCKKFNISATTAQRIMDEVVNEARLDVKYIVDPEHEIKGLVWEYNPERDIKGLTVPQY
jgi:hypothetical protein